jgi:hypothetical protein
VTKVKTKWTVGKYQGPSAFSDWLTDYNKSVQREARKRLRGAAFYCRRVARNSMKPAGKPRKVAGRPWKSSKPSAPGKPPKYRKGKKLKNIWSEKVDDWTYRIGPVPFSGAGGNTTFSGKGDVFQEVGGSGQVRLPLSLEQMSSDQRRQLAKTKKWPMVWKNANYRARPYLEPARDKTLEKFPKLFSNLNVRKR